MTDFTGVGHASPYPGSSRAVAALQDGAGNSSSAEPESSAVGAGSSSIYAETEVHSAQHYEPLGSTGTATLARPMQDVQMGQDINLLRGPRHHPAPDEPFDLHIKSTPICAGTIDANKTPLPGPSSKDTEMHVADEPLHHVGSKDPVISTAGSGSSKGKQKQKAVHFEPSMPAQVSIARTEVPDGQPIAEDLKPGDARWATSSEKPPAKLPIRLLDALGRTFVFPWEKVKTWQVFTFYSYATFLRGGSSRSQCSRPIVVRQASTDTA